MTITEKGVFDDVALFVSLLGDDHVVFDKFCKSDDPAKDICSLGQSENGHAYKNRLDNSYQFDLDSRSRCELRPLDDLDLRNCGADSGPLRSNRYPDCGRRGLFQVHQELSPYQVHRRLDALV